MEEKKDVLREKLFYTQKHGYDRIELDERLKLEAYCEDYKAFLNSSEVCSTTNCPIFPRITGIMEQYSGSL